MIAEQAVAYSEERTLQSNEPVGIYLGIDFGTSYTKVCYRIRGRGINQVKVLPLEPATQTPGIIPSVVYEATDGKLYTALSGNIPPVSITNKFLKMRLANTWLADPCMTSSKDICLSAFYISEVLKASKKYILQAETSRLEGKRVLWYAKLCVPIGESNHALLDSFAGFYDRCWQLADRSYGNSLSEIAAILQSINTDPNNSPCQAYPEIGAAVHSFLLTREAVPGLYCYIDIGGGTLDCSSFHLKRDMNGHSSIYVYSTKVSRLGMESISEHIGISPEELDRLDVAVPNVSSIGIQKKIVGIKERIQQQVAQSIVEMREKAKEDKSWGLRYESYTTHIGGGGAKSRWYRNVIQSTRNRWTARDSIYEKFILQDIPFSAELIVPNESIAQRHRFAVAYGLTAPFGEDTPIQGFPWQFFLVSPLGDSKETCVDEPDTTNVPCTCQGINPDCIYCGGWGYIDKIGRSRALSNNNTAIPKSNSKKKRSKPEQPAALKHDKSIIYTERILAGLIRKTPKSRCEICGKKLNFETFMDHLASVHPIYIQEANAHLKNLESLRKEKRIETCPVQKATIKTTSKQKPDTAMMYRPFSMEKLEAAGMDTIDRKILESQPKIVKVEAGRPPLLRKGGSNRPKQGHKNRNSVKVVSYLPTKIKPQSGTGHTLKVDLKTSSKDKPPDMIRIKYLDDLMVYLRIKGIASENKRNKGGSIWVYMSKYDFQPIADFLKMQGVFCRYYPSGRKKRAGEQWEIDVSKKLF